MTKTTGGGSSPAVSANVRVFMALNRESHEDVAAVLGISRPAVSARLNGHTVWTLGDVDRLAQHYDVPASTFLSMPSATIAAAARAARRPDGRKPATRAGNWSREEDDDQLAAAAGI